jgi:hypothetical protein
MTSETSSVAKSGQESVVLMVAAAAAHSSHDSWDGPLPVFLAALDPGSAHDWVRAAVGKPSGTNRDR